MRLLFRSSQPCAGGRYDWPSGGKAGLACAKAAAGGNVTLCRFRSARRTPVYAHCWPQAEIAPAFMPASRYATIPDFCPFLQSCALDEFRPPCWLSCFLGQFASQDWCEIIESPLRKGLDQKTRTQLRKTVLGPNDRQEICLIRFHSHEIDGRIRWEHAFPFKE